MTAQVLLAGLATRGIKVILDDQGTGLLVTPGKGQRLSDQDREAIREAKPDLVRLLQVERAITDYLARLPTLADGQRGEARLVTVAVVTVDGLPPVAMSPEEAEAFEATMADLALHNGYARERWQTGART